MQITLVEAVSIPQLFRIDLYPFHLRFSVHRMATDLTMWCSSSSSVDVTVRRITQRSSLDLHLNAVNERNIMLVSNIHSWSLALLIHF